MAALINHTVVFLLCLLFIVLANSEIDDKPLNKECIDINFGFYLESCPETEPIIFSHVERAISEDPRMAASLLRLHFHDCFVNGCDGSVLLDDTNTMVGEKTAGPNLNSLRGFEVIDAIKSDLESACPRTVSCADILAIAARDSVLLSGGPTWEVQTGRKDGLSANKAAANTNIPAPTSDVPTLISNFNKLGLTLSDMVALSGAHTIGKARCTSFRSRLTTAHPTQDPAFLQSLNQLCDSGNATLAHLDLLTPAIFDNQYYINLVSGEGLLQSDDALGADDRTRSLVEAYAADADSFFEDFKNAMVRMGALAGTGGEIRTNCRVVN